MERKRGLSLSSFKFQVDFVINIMGARGINVINIIFKFTAFLSAVCLRGNYFITSKPMNLAR